MDNVDQGYVSFSSSLDLDSLSEKPDEQIQDVQIQKVLQDSENCRIGETLSAMLEYLDLTFLKLPSPEEELLEAQEQAKFPKDPIFRSIFKDLGITETLRYNKETGLDESIKLGSIPPYPKKASWKDKLRELRMRLQGTLTRWGQFIMRIFSGKTKKILNPFKSTMLTNTPSVTEPVNVYESITPVSTLRYQAQTNLIDGSSFFQPTVA